MAAENKNVYEVASESLSEIAKHKDKMRDIESYLVENHKMPRGTFIQTVANLDAIGEVEENKVAVFVNAIFEITKDERVKPDNIYGAKKINEIKKYKFEESMSAHLPYTIDGVRHVIGDNYLTSMSYKEIAKLWNSKILTYNFQTQRLSKKKINAKGKITEKADIKNKSIDEIVRLMESGKYEPSTLIFNVPIDEGSNIEYDDGIFILNEGCFNLIDGAHRVMAIVKVMEGNPNFEGYMNIDLKVFPIRKAQFLLSVTNRTNRFDRTLVKYYGGEEYGQEITKSLMELPVLKNRIEIKTALDKKITITNFAIVSEGIQNIFEPQNTKDKYDIEDTLKRFFEYFMPTYEDKLIKNRNEELKVSWFPHHNLFVGHLVLAKKLYDKHGKDFPVDEIVRIVDAIDYNKETSELTEIMGGQGKSNSNKVKQQIKRFFEEKVDSLLK